MREAARLIKPAPLSLVVFGSFARGEAGPDSDVDVLAVRPDEAADLEDVWTDSLGRWVGVAGRITGNPVRLIEVDLEELRRKGGEATGYAARCEKGSRWWVDQRAN